jgi:hypothetical protein
MYFSKAFSIALIFSAAALTASAHAQEATSSQSAKSWSQLAWEFSGATLETTKSCGVGAGKVIVKEYKKGTPWDKIEQAMALSFHDQACLSAVHKMAVAGGDLKSKGHDVINPPPTPEEQKQMDEQRAQMRAYIERLRIHNIIEFKDAKDDDFVHSVKIDTMRMRVLAPTTINKLAGQPWTEKRDVIFKGKVVKKGDDSYLEEFMDGTPLCQVMLTTSKAGDQAERKDFKRVALNEVLEVLPPTAETHRSGGVIFGFKDQDIMLSCFSTAVAIEVGQVKQGLKGIVELFPAPAPNEPTDDVSDYENN